MPPRLFGLQTDSASGRAAKAAARAAAVDVATRVDKPHIGRAAQVSRATENVLRRVVVKPALNESCISRVSCDWRCSSKKPLVVLPV